MAAIDSSLDESSSEDEQVTVANPVHIYYKILLLGDLAVGKSSISCRIADDRFYENYVITIGKHDAEKKKHHAPSSVCFVVCLFLH